MSSFFFCNSAKFKRWRWPFFAALVVGPEGTVGAWMLFILSGNPIVFGRDTTGEFPAAVPSFDSFDDCSLSVCSNVLSQQS